MSNRHPNKNNVRHRPLRHLQEASGAKMWRLSLGLLLQQGASEGGMEEAQDSLQALPGKPRNFREHCITSI